MQLKNDGYDHVRVPASPSTRRKMSEAKRGRTYTPEHRLNMQVTHILKGCLKNNKDPIEHVSSLKKYSTLEKRAIIKRIIERTEPKEL